MDCHRQVGFNSVVAISNLGGILAPAKNGYIAHATRSFALALGITAVILFVGILLADLAQS